MVLDGTKEARSSKSFQRSNARRMRREPTEAEKRFWWEVKDRRLYGHKFSRQYLVGRYVVDFVCLKEKLIVKVDGGQHSEAAEHDGERDRFLSEQGFRVRRFWNADVLTNMEGVMDTVPAAIGGTEGCPSSRLPC